MKKLILLIALLYFINPLFSQNKSQYLVAYGQTWGFLKYFHPHPSSTNWDNNLLEDYAKIKKCPTDKAFNEIISHLISQCGDYKKHERHLADSLVFTESFEWINGSLFSEANRAYLKELKNNKPKFRNKYVQPNKGVSNPIISNEVNYADSLFSNSICYLGITRNWNVINYFFPNRQLIKQNWDSVYLKLIPEFVNLSDMDDYYLAVRHLNAKINDGHGFTRSKKDIYQSYNLPHIWCKSFTEGTFISSIEKGCETILKKSDRIVAIDGISIEARYEEVLNICAASNHYYLKRYSYYLLMTENDNISITVKRGDSLITEKLKTYPIQNYTSKKKKAKNTSIKRKPPYYILPNDSIPTTGYIHMGRLKRKNINKAFKKTIDKTKNLIIDCRNYPNWIVYPLCKVLLNERKDFCRFTHINMGYPGSYSWGSQLRTGKNNKKYYKGNIYLLVDNGTMSRAEFTVMALQTAYKVITIGGQTAGADGNLSEVPMPFGLRSCFSGYGVYYPNGDPTQQIGVRRDYKIVQDSTYLNGQDKIFNFALKLIKENANREVCEYNSVE